MMFWLMVWSQLTGNDSALSFSKIVKMYNFHIIFINFMTKTFKIYKFA